MKILITSTLSNNVTIHEFNGKKISDLREYLIENNLFEEGMAINGNTDLSNPNNDIPDNLKVVTVTPAKSSAAKIDFSNMSYNDLKSVAKEYRVEAVENDDETLLDIVHSKYMSIPKNDLIVMLTNAFEYLNPASATSLVSDDQVSKLSEVIDKLEERVFEIEYSLQLLTDVNKLRFLNRLKKDYPHLVK